MEEVLHRTELGRGAGVGWMAVGIETALIADADAVGIVMSGMGADFFLGTARVEVAILRDVIVVTDGAEATSLVAGFESLYREVLRNLGGRTVNDDEIDLSHVYFILYMIEHRRHSQWL